MNSALHIAIESRQLEIARVLLQYGANVDAAGDSGTPLEIALDWLTGPVSLELVQLLLASGADVNARKPGSPTALHHAIFAMQDLSPTSKEVVEILLRAGADAAARTRSGATPLTVLLEMPECKDRATLVKMLIQHEARRSCWPTDTPVICLAALKNEPEVLRILIEAGMDVNRSDKSGTPLHHAASNGFSGNVELLLMAGADPCALDTNGRTPIECIAPKLLEALNILEQHVRRTAG